MQKILKELENQNQLLKQLKPIKNKLKIIL